MNELRKRMKSIPIYLNTILISSFAVVASTAAAESPITSFNRMKLKMAQRSVEDFKITHAQMPETVEEAECNPLNFPGKRVKTCDTLIDPDWTRAALLRVREDRTKYEIAYLGEDHKPGGVGANADVKIEGPVKLVLTESGKEEDQFKVAKRMFLSNDQVINTAGFHGLMAAAADTDAAFEDLLNTLGAKADKNLWDDAVWLAALLPPAKRERLLVAALSHPSPEITYAAMMALEKIDSDSARAIVSENRERKRAQR